MKEYTPEGMKYICISRRSHDVTPNRLPPDSTNISRAAATTFIQRNWPALLDQKDVYLLLGIPSNDYAL